MKIQSAISGARGNCRPAPRPRTHGRSIHALGILGCALLLGPAARGQTILGSTGNYAVMAGSTVTINGATNTTLTGDLGAASIAGAGPYTVSGSTAPFTAQNQTDFTRAFTGLAAMAMTSDLTGQILGSGGTVPTLTPGVYRFTSTAQLTGTLTLDAQNQSNAVWVFQIGSTFDTAASSAVTFINTTGAGSIADYGVFWQVGTTTVLGANTALEGNVLGGTTFNMGSGATILHGRALTGTSQTITLDANTIDFVGANSGYAGGLGYVDSGNTIMSVPEPATYALIAAVAALSLVFWRRSRVTA